MADDSPLAETLSELDTLVIEQGPAALCVCRAPDGEIIRHNALAVRLWGRTPAPGERLTGAWRTRFPEGRLMPVEESAMAVVLSGGAASRDRHMIVERPDGSSVAITASVSPLQDQSGRLVGAICAFEEVTADRRMPAEQALAVERQRRETFVSTLAHELRQPLSALLAAVEVMRLTPDSDAANRATEIMKRQIGQMNRVVEDLVDATRWARGKVTIRKQRLDVREVIRDATLDLTAAVAEHGHELVIATAPEPLWVDADPQRLYQVLSNLLRNAVTYTDPGGRVSLAADRGAATVIVRVSDTGRGIDPEALTHVFDLFSQVRSFDAAGLGIGLSVVREIVALHEGRIEARSEGPGHGSEFIVTLPLAHHPETQRAIAT